MTDRVTTPTSDSDCVTDRVTTRDVFASKILEANTKTRHGPGSEQGLMMTRERERDSSWVMVFLPRCYTAYMLTLLLIYTGIPWHGGLGGTIVIFLSTIQTSSKLVTRSAWIPGGSWSVMIRGFSSSATSNRRIDYNYRHWNLDYEIQYSDRCKCCNSLHVAPRRHHNHPTSRGGRHISEKCIYRVFFWRLFLLFVRIVIFQYIGKSLNLFNPSRS